MVRVPVSWMRAGMAGLAGSGSGVSPQIRRMRVTPGDAYQFPVTVDLGNDGVAPTVVFGGGGTAQAFTGPVADGETWSLDQCYISTSVGQLDAALCTVYIGPLPVATMTVTGSLAGGGTQFGLGGSTVPNGWFVWALWTGGTPGSTGYLRVTGRKTVLTA